MRTTVFAEKTLGAQTIDNIVINTIVPVIFAYGHINNEPAYKEKAVRWLNELSAEENNVTRQWKLSGVVNESAFDSQALNELAKQYCWCKQCLNCSVRKCHSQKTIKRINSRGFRSS